MAEYVWRITSVGRLKTSGQTRNAFAQAASATEGCGLNGAVPAR